MIGVFMDNLEETLLDVRKAYRLLHIFNKRIFSLMQYIEESFDLRYGGGKSLFTADSPSAWKGAFDNWTWDYFNLYFYQHYFENNNTWLSILLQSDTGLWDIIEDINDEDELSEKAENVKMFNSVEESKTRLIFVTSNGKWSDDVINELYNKNLNKNIKREGVINLNSKIKIFYKIFGIENFIDENITIETLTKYIKFLNDNDFKKIKLIKNS
jgi:hypothetical protein